MTRFPRMKAAWEPIGLAFNEGPVMDRLRRGEVTVDHYKSVLRQIFHHTRENPQLQAYCTAYFRGSQRAMVKKFLQHATSEVGHDQLAVEDLRALGADVTGIEAERPLPATLALIAYGFYQVQFLNPIGYLGYLFQLEFSPTQYGDRWATALRNAGVPNEAMSFVNEHVAADVGHNKLMEMYVEKLVTTEDDFAAVVHAMEVTAQLYGAMIEQAFAEADREAAAVAG